MRVSLMTKQTGLWKSLEKQLRFLHAIKRRAQGYQGSHILVVPTGTANEFNNSASRSIRVERCAALLLPLVLAASLGAPPSLAPLRAVLSQRLSPLIVPRRLILSPLLMSFSHCAAARLPCARTHLSAHRGSLDLSTRPNPHRPFRTLRGSEPNHPHTS